MPDPAASVLADLRSESEEVDRLVAELDDTSWSLPTPAAGWSVAHQIAHLAWTDTASLLAVTDATAFAGLAAKALATPTPSWTRAPRPEPYCRRTNSSPAGARAATSSTWRCAPRPPARVFPGTGRP